MKINYNEFINQLPRSITIEARNELFRQWLKVNQADSKLAGNLLIEETKKVTSEPVVS